MGLDGVELILAIEDGFAIHIENEEAARVSTVGDLYHLVTSKLHVGDSKRCLTSAAFYRTRRGIVDSLGVDPRQIKPSTPLEEILPERGRREKWRRIQDAMQLKLPDLRHGGSVLLCLFAAGITLAVAPGVYGGVGRNAVACLSLLGLVVGGFLVKFSPVLAVEFPSRNATVGDLARGVLALNSARLVVETGDWSGAEVWDVLCNLIVEQTGVERKKVTPEALIVDDLGID